MQPPSDKRLVFLLKYPPLTFLVIDQSEMGTLCQYPLTIEQYQFHILGLYYKYTVRIIHFAIIGEGCPCTLSLSNVLYTSTYVTIHL